MRYTLGVVDGSFTTVMFLPIDSLLCALRVLFWFRVGSPDVVLVHLTKRLAVQTWVLFKSFLSWRWLSVLFGRCPSGVHHRLVSGFDGENV